SRRAGARWVECTHRAPRGRHAAPSARHRARRPPGRRRPPPHRARGLQLTRVWRICRRPYAAFDGEGARQAGGRWNHRGVAVVYTSATLSLAALECFVHLDPSDAPTDLVVIPAAIPDRAARREIAAATLPPSWRRYPGSDALADLGTAWVRAGASAILVVPSAIVPRERNFLLNPAHPDFRQVRLGAAEPFSFDPRMW